MGQVPERVGWWKFDDPNNLTKPEPGYGSPLVLAGTDHGDEGPTADNGCTRIGVGSYYVMTHGIAPNGGGSYVNDYTLQFDFLVAEKDIWYTFFQTTPDNSTDGECFINPGGNIGVAATGYSDFNIETDQWYRLVISVSNGTHYRYYLDGQLLLDGAIQEIDDRFSLQPTLLIFADNDGDDGEIDVAEVAIWDQALTSYQIQQLGGYGHQLPVDPMQADGRWKFDHAGNPTEGFIGKDLVLTGTQQMIEGPSATNRAVRIGVGSYYSMEHGIAANGGGSYVNEFTLQFDISLDSLGNWITLFQTNPVNSNDGDCFISDEGKIGVASTGYGAYKLIPKDWYRLIISVKNGEFFRYYLDGQLLLEGDKQDIDGRYGLENTLLLFADNDGEDSDINVAEVAIWGRALSADEVSKLGGYGHDLTNPSSNTKKLVGRWKFDDSSNLLKPEPDEGLPLELVGTQKAVNGPEAGNGAVRIGIGSHYKMTHGISGNGGGIAVNEYTLQYDFRIADYYGWHCFFQTSSANANDGDCFINSNGNIGTQATGYTEYSVIPNEWYRLVISVKNGSQFQYYLDGQLVRNGTLQSIDGRFSLENILLVFADEDGEDGEIDCAELAIWNYALTAAEVQALGGYGHKTAVEEESNGLSVVSEYQLSQNYPNPFNPQTTISYALVQAGRVRLDLFNALGQRVSTLADEFQDSGRHSVRFNGASWPSGIYFYRLTVNNYSQTKKMLLSK